MQLAIITTVQNSLLLVIDLRNITLSQAMVYYEQNLTVHIRNN